MNASAQSGITEHWNNRATSYLQTSRRDFGKASTVSRWKQLLANAIGNTGPLHILDAGCGPGVMTRLLLEMGHRVTAVDISRQMLAHARCSLAALTPQVSFSCAEASVLPFADNSFDAVMSRYLVWTLLDPVRALREWQRVSKPGGTVAVIDGNWYYRYYRSRPARWWTTCMNTLYRAWSGHRSGHCLAAGYARDLPCTHVLRPEWDIAVLSDLGYVDITVQRNVERQIWGIISPKRLKYLGSRQFIISGIKPG